ncbi:adenylate kinase 5%2C like [Xyrichtys novacula]|uniref:Adenylate kinase 5, like n=1 Tax=Xyrichtys novacula TaxID=13765 RepID=A0AAV1G8G7_XYRNO|nr:adenylate kinase 5%2C like [Xyrichtys novacula]
MLNGREVKDYLSRHHISQLLESLLTGLLYHHPEDPISFLHSCLIITTQLGGPGAITWNSFIHLEGQQLSHGPPRTTCVPTMTTSEAATTASLPLITTSVPLDTVSAPPRTMFLPPRTTPFPSATPLIPQKNPQIIPTLSTISKPASIPPITPPKIAPLVQTSALIFKPATVKCQISSPLPRTPIPQPITPTLTPWIIPPITTTAAPPPYSLPITPPIKPKIAVLPPLTPQLPPINNKTLLKPSQIASEEHPQILLQAQSTPEVTSPPVFAESKEEPESFNIRGLPPSPVRSQLSIDSDSDMTESSGLQQEVSIKPPKRPRPVIIFITGGPGSGKGSQAARLAQDFNLRVISLAELIRKQLLSQASPSKKWEVISQMMSHGELDLQEETISELRRNLISQQEVKGFIVDGFPRDVHQALSFQEQIGSPDLVMLLLCSNETLRGRLQRRASELGLLGDSSHAFRKRLDTFQKDIVSVRRYYKQLKLLKQVDADRDEDQVFADLSSVIREKLPQKESSSIDSADLPECNKTGPAVPSNMN